MLCNTVKKYHPFPGFTLLLGSILQYRNVKQSSDVWFPPGLVASLYLFRQQGEGHLLDDVGFSGISQPNGQEGGTGEFLAHFTELLENPERSGAYAFDQHKYATAANECLQLYLCNHRTFSKGAPYLAYHDRVLLKKKPWKWKVRQGTHSRILKARWESFKRIKTQDTIYQRPYFPLSSSEQEHYRSLAYEWALDLLPIFLDKSAISLELADVLRTCTLRRAQQFQQKMRLAKKAITTYLLRVNSAVGRP